MRVEKYMSPVAIQFDEYGCPGLAICDMDGTANDRSVDCDRYFPVDDLPAYAYGNISCNYRVPVDVKHIGHECGHISIYRFIIHIISPERPGFGPPVYTAIYCMLYYIYFTVV